MRVLAYGALNPDLVHLVDRVPSPGDDLRSRSWQLTWGGKVANAAVALATWGMEARLSGAVIGTDPLGDALLDALAMDHLDLGSIERSPDTRTGHIIVLVTPDGDRTMIAAGYDEARWHALGDDDWADVGAVILDAFGGDAARQVATEARRRGVAVIWPDAHADDAALADVVVWSTAEHTSDEAIAIAAPQRVVVLTDGPRPTRVWASGATIEALPPHVAAVDATGAGDVFAAAVARGLVLGWDLPRWLAWANAASAALAHRGRAAGMPAIADIERLAVGG
jgi:ribokinase